MTIITSFAVSFGLMGLITFGTLSASNHGLFRDKNEETYEHRGMTFVKIPAIYEMCRERLLYEREELWGIGKQDMIRCMVRKTGILFAMMM